LRPVRHRTRSHRRPRGDRAVRPARVRPGRGTGVADPVATAPRRRGCGTGALGRAARPVASTKARRMNGYGGPLGPAALGTQPPSLAGYETAGDLLRALAAPIRIAIVVELGAGPRCVHELVAAIGAAQPLVSQHLRVLRGAGVVQGERRGREIAYSL